MNDKQTDSSPIAWIPRFMHTTVAVVVLALSGARVEAQASSAISPTNKQGDQMKQFVFIFRQGKRLLSQEEQKQRAIDVRAWALAQLEEGRKLDPHILGEENYHAVPDGRTVPSPQSSEQSVTAIVFLEATDFSEAIKVAKTHPGLRYGISVEVREWSPPPSQPISKPPKE